MSFNKIIIPIAKYGLIVSVIFTAMQLVKKDEWWIRISDFPHIQITVLTLIFLLLFIFSTSLKIWHSWVIICLGLGTLCYQVVIIYPYTSISPKQSMNSEFGTEPSISILEANVYMHNDRYYDFITQIKNYSPDIVIALEADEKWEKGLEVIEIDYPFHAKYPLDNTYGLLLYSKLELVDTEFEFLVDEDIPSLRTLVRLRNDELIELFIVHPEPPSPTESYKSTERDAELVLVGRKAAKSNYPVIVAGDLNDVAWSHTTRLFQRISGLLDPRIGRGFFNTYNANYWLLRWPLDHVYHSDQFLVNRIERGARIGSDHFPMFIELSLSPEDGQLINGSAQEPSKDDRKEAEETLEKVN